MHQQRPQAGGEAEDLVEGEGDEIRLVLRQVQRGGAGVGGCVQQHEPPAGCGRAHRAHAPRRDLSYPGQRVPGAREVTLSRVTEEMRKLAVGVAGGSTSFLRRPHVLRPDRDGSDTPGCGDHPHAHHGGVAVGEVTEEAPAAPGAPGHPREGFRHQFKGSRAPGGENHAVVLWGGVEVRQDPGKHSIAAAGLTGAQCLQ